MAIPILNAKPGDYKKLAWIVPTIIGTGLLIVGVAFYQIEIKGKQETGAERRSAE